MVLVMVNPGRRIRDKVNQRDAVGGDLVEVRDVERKVLMYRGYVSDPPPNETQASPPVADETQAPEPVRNQVGLRLGEALPGSTDNGGSGVPVTGEAPVESTPESTPGAEFQKSADELAAEFKAELEAVEQDQKEPEAEAQPQGNSPEGAQAEDPAPRRRRRNTF